MIDWDSPSWGGNVHESETGSSEALAREYARDHSMILRGEEPTRYGEVYTRRWVGPDRVLKAIVQEVYS